MLKVGMLNEFEISYLERFLNKEVVGLSYIVKDLGVEILVNKTNDIITGMKYMINMIRKIKSKEEINH